MGKSIVQQVWDECYLCGRPATEVHHILGGTANRKLSERYSLVVHLCHNCHLGADGAQYAPEVNRRLKMEAQIAFEEIYGHEKWMQIFRRNYIIEQEGIEGYV